MFQSYLFIGKAQQNSLKIEELTTALSINTHASSVDMSILEPIKNTVTIDQIRILKKTIYQKPLSGKYRLYIIREADTLTKEAQNALLKILEEPPQHAIIILDGAKKENFLDTIISRVICIQTQDTAKSTNTTVLSYANEQEALEEVAQVTDPKNWLDEQMNVLYQLLIDKIQAKKNINHSKQKIVETIELCAQTKKMLEANVNPKHLLASLIFTVHLH